MDEVLAQFKELQQKCVAVEVENRKLLEKLRRDEPVKPRIYSMQEDEKEVVQDSRDSDLVYRLSECSIRDYERWQQRKHRNSDRDNGDFRQIAKNTYDKQIQKIKKPSGTAKVRHMDVVAGGRLRVHDELTLVDELANSMETSNQQRYERSKRTRSKHALQEEDAYINDKNRHFNERISKELSQYKEEN